jgi:hypothetical protein
MSRFSIAAIAVVLVLTGCAASQDPSAALVPAPSAAEPPSSPVATAAPQISTTADPFAPPPASPFGGDCDSAFTSKEIGSALKRPVRLTPRPDQSVLFDEAFVMAEMGVLVCSWEGKEDDFEVYATAYVMHDALVPSPGDSVSCNHGYAEDSTDDWDTLDAGRCFFDFSANGLWASVTLFKAVGYDEAALRRGGADLAKEFEARASSQEPAVNAGLRTGTWQLPPTCATFANVDYSGIADKPVLLETDTYPQGEGEADGRVLAIAAAGELSCNIEPAKKRKDGGAYGNFFVLPGMAAALGSVIPLEGDEVDVEGADIARLFPYPNLYYVVTSGPNVIVANIYSPKGDKAARKLLSDLISAANGG